MQQIEKSHKNAVAVRTRGYIALLVSVHLALIWHAICALQFQLVVTEIDECALVAKSGEQCLPVVSYWKRKSGREWQCNLGSSVGCIVYACLSLKIVAAVAVLVYRVARMIHHEALLALAGASARFATRKTPHRRFQDKTPRINKRRRVADYLALGRLIPNLDH